MFNDSGSKIKVVANVFFVLGLVATVALAIAFGWERKYGYSGRVLYSEFKAGSFFGFLIGGVVASYMFALMLYGFGELVENSSVLPGISDAIENKDHTGKKPNAFSSAGPIKTFENGDWVCPLCGTRNPEYAESCTGCNEKV